MKRLNFLMMLALSWVLAACGSQEPVVILPTATPNPLAVFAPTAISPGNPQNPLEILYAPAVQDENTASEAQTLQSALSAASGLTLTVTTVDSYGAALAAMCDYNDGERFVAAWLDGLTAPFALAQNCGEPILKATALGVDGLAGQIVGQRGASSLGALAGRGFCRLSATDYYSWVLPSVSFLANRFDATQIVGVIDVTPDLLLSSIVDGSCYAAGVPQGTLALASADVAAALVVVEETPPLPFGVLFIPQEMLLPDRQAFIDAYLQLGGAADPDAAETEDVASEPAAVDPEAILRRSLNESNSTAEQRALYALIGAEGVARASADDLTVASEFMRSAGFALEQFGRP